MDGEHEDDSDDDGDEGGGHVVDDGPRPRRPDADLSKAAVAVMRLDTMSGRIRHCGRTRVCKWQDDETV